MFFKTISIIGSKIDGVSKAAFWLSIFSLFSQILALLRDRLLSHYFGIGNDLDIYYASFKIPDLIFVTVASIVSISALVPLFARKETEGERHLKEAKDSIFTVFALAIIFFSLLSFIFMPILIKISFQNLGTEMIIKIILFSRILLLSPLLLGFSNFFGSIIQYEKRFILYSLSPIFYNLGIISGIYFLKDFGISSAVYGVVLGSFLHILLQAIYVGFSNQKPRLTLLIKWRDVIETVKLSVPRTFALSISSFVSFFFTILAGSISVGAIAIFNLSSNLQSAPIALIGASFSLAAFPALAASFAKNDLLDLVKKISEGLRQIVFWSLPFTVFMIVLRAHIVRVILGSGVFDWSATRLVAGSLALFIISLVFQNILIFLSRSHYALGKTLWPLLANLISGLTAVLLALVMLDKFEFFNYFLAMIASFLKIADLSYRVVILPLALSVGSTVGAILLFFALGENIRSSVWREIKWPIFRSVLASLVGGIVSYQALRALDGLFSLQKFWGVLGHGFFAGLAGIVFWLFMLFILKDQDFQRLFSFMKSKLTKI